MNDPSQEETITGLKSIWEDEHVTKLPIIDGGQRQWKCLWCNNTFNQWNSTKAIYHLNRVKGYSIKPCSSAEIDAESECRYACLMLSLEVKRKRISEKRVASMHDLEDNSKNITVVCPPTAPLLSVGSVWEDKKVLKRQNDTGEKSWQCLWCQQHFSQWNATKAIHHLNRRKGCDIKPCSSDNIDEASKRRYADLMIAVQAKRRKKHKKFHNGNGIEEEETDDLATTATNALATNSQPPTKNPLTSIWDDDHVQREKTVTGEKFWKCLRCDRKFSQWNSTKAIYHVNQSTGCDIQPCTSTRIDEEHKQQYEALLSLLDTKREQKRKLESMETENGVSSDTTLAVRDSNENESDNESALAVRDSNENDSDKKRGLKQARVARDFSAMVETAKPSSATLNSIWDDGYVIKTRKPTGEKCWECVWCQRQFSQWNATKAIYHVNQFRGNDIQPCTSRYIDKEHKRQYRGLMEALRNKRKKQKLQRKGKDLFASFVEKIVEQHDEEVANNLISIIGDRM